MMVRDIVLEQLYPFQKPSYMMLADLKRAVLKEEKEATCLAVDEAVEQLDIEGSIERPKNPVSANYQLSITPLGKSRYEHHKIRAEQKLIDLNKDFSEKQKAEIRKLLKELLQEIEEGKNNKTRMEQIAESLKKIQAPLTTAKTLIDIADFVLKILRG